MEPRERGGPCPFCPDSFDAGPRLLLFSKKFFFASPRRLAGRLLTLVSGSPRPGIEDAREWLVFAGQLEQAVLDGAGPPDVAEVTDHAAALFLAVRDRREGAPPLLHGDGRLQPKEWVRLADGSIRKRNATGTDCEHCWTGPQSVLWDVAGAAVEWNMRDQGLSLLLQELADGFGINAGRHGLAFHRAGYCCLRLAQMQHRADGWDAPRYEAELRMALKQLDRLP